MDDKSERAEHTFCILMDDPTRMRDEDVLWESFFASINTFFDVFLMGFGA